MSRILAIILIVLAVVLIAAATIHTSELAPAKTPQGAVQALLNRAKNGDYAGAYSYV